MIRPLPARHRTEEVARTAVELTMKVADVLLQVIKKRQPWIRVPEDAGSAMAARTGRCGRGRKRSRR